MNIGNKPQNVYTCAGLYRSGSTFLFNVIRFGFLNAGNTVHSDFYKERQETEVEPDVKVFKAHGYIRELEKRSSVILMTVRDPVDIVASMVRRNLLKEDDIDSILVFIEKLLIQEYKPWSVRAKKIYRYEDIIVDQSKFVSDVLDQIGLRRISPQVVIDDIEKQKLVVLSKRDSASQLWPNHITSRGVGDTQPLTAGTITKIIRLSEDFRTQFGYGYK